MAEYRLQAGASIDILTQKELDHSLSSLAHDSVVERGRGVKWLRFPLLAGTLTGQYPNASSSFLGGPGKCGPNPGYAWAIRRFSVTGLSGGSSASTTTSTATGSITAGAGSAALANGVSATGFTVTFSAAPSSVGTLVLSNVTGGPYTYNVTTTPQNPYSVNFPGPITATSGSVAPTLTAAGLGTGAGTIELYGQSVTAAVGADQLYVFRNEVVASQFIASLSGQTATNFIGFTNVQAVLMSGDDLIISPGTTFNASGVINVTAEGVEVPAEMLWKIA